LPNGSSVGLGWFLRTVDEHQAFGYVGTTLGYKAHILIDPSRSTAAILLCNSLLESTKELFGVVTAAASRGSAPLASRVRGS
jgi:alpha-beta hydrolase superfamily lysophospholipase